MLQLCLERVVSDRGCLLTLNKRQPHSAKEILRQIYIVAILYSAQIFSSL